MSERELVHVSGGGTVKIETWRMHYNQRYFHSALGWMTSSEFAEKSAGWENMQPT